ncbi:ATP-binding protein [Halomicrococcus gelatinilyticus]|uniref:hypothetical protein n=1 Tax=Halomicrococcus gelatinilyticus TaxID=1702103 RepID=UPI002E0F0165
MSERELPNSVDREDQLQKIFDCVLSAEEKGHFLSLVGPGGHGKSSILEEIRTEFENDDDVYILNFQFHSGLTNIEHFSSEFEEKWREEVPQSVTRRMTERAVKILQSQKLKNAIDYISTGGGIISPNLSLLSLSKKALPEKKDKNLAPAYSDLLTEFLDQFHQLNPDTRLLLLFDEYHKIPGEKKAEFDRLFHSIASEMPKGIVGIVASRTRDLCEGYDSPIAEIRLGEFSEREVEMYLQEAGFSPTEEQIKTVHETTSGNPYYLKRFTQTAYEHGLADAIDRLPEREIRRYLDDAFLNQLEESQEQFLRDISVLDEFREDIITHLTGETRAHIRRQLRSLHRKSVLEGIGTHESVSVYQPHDLLHQHLKNSLSQEKLNQQHRTVASFYLNKLDQDVLNDSVQNFIWALMFEESPESGPIESFAEATAECFAAGSMLHFHLEEISSDDTIEEEIYQLLQDPDIDENRVLNNLRVFYADNDEVDLESIDIGGGDSDKSEIDVIDLEASTPEKQLIVEFVRCVRIIEGDGDDIEKYIQTLKESKERVRKINNNEELNIVSGLVYLFILFTLEACYVTTEQKDMVKKTTKCREKFIKDHFGLDDGDRIFTKNMTKALTQRFKMPRGESGELLSDDPESTIEKAVLERGAFGGIQSGMNEVILDLIQSFYETRTSNKALSHDRKLIEDAIREIAIYFNQNDHPSLAAFIRDAGKLITASLSSDTPNKDEIMTNFKNTEAHQQIQRVITAIDT